MQRGVLKYVLRKYGAIIRIRRIILFYIVLRQVMTQSYIFLYSQSQSGMGLM